MTNVVIIYARIPRRLHFTLLPVVLVAVTPRFVPRPHRARSTIILPLPFATHVLFRTFSHLHIPFPSAILSPDFPFTHLGYYVYRLAPHAMLHFFYNCYPAIPLATLRDFVGTVPPHVLVAVTHLAAIHAAQCLYGRAYTAVVESYTFTFIFCYATGLSWAPRSLPGSLSALTPRCRAAGRCLHYSLPPTCFNSSAGHLGFSYVRAFRICEFPLALHSNHWRTHLMLRRHLWLPRPTVYTADSPTPTIPSFAPDASLLFVALIPSR